MNADSLQKAFTLLNPSIFEVNPLDVKLFVDGDEISLNKFVAEILGGTIVGGINSLHGVKKDWKMIRIEIRRVQ